MAIEDPEKRLALELSGMIQKDEGESPQKKFKMDLKPPEANSSIIAEDYFNLFQEETRKFDELENERSVITQDKIDQVWDRDIKKGIRQRMEILPEGRFVEPEEDLKLYQQNNGNWENKYKQRRRFEDLEEGELSENTQRLAGISILEEFNDAYEQIFCFSNISLSSSADSFNQNQGIGSRLTNDSQNQNGIQEDVPQYEGEEDYVILPMITFEELYYYDLDSPII
ncbi:hypothetical protein O181_030687 [Austropuccinia psidii MF-1]|uniref:Uncharacterized protein n=1 Tax=Austropuccinia psidii MF-1 TaxID=1389203 RepID=A0A9Q3CW79_9BASI|nr:hypothetical protein [Austropuccinia psidii MF-1]